jgi:outer membrane protein TolC
VGPLVSWTFPNTSATRARIAQAQAAAAAALAQFDGVVLRALQQLESALTTYARDLEQTAALRAARDQSAEAAREANLLYRAGKEGFLTVLDAERTLATNESALASAESRLVADQIALFLALGGGW